MIARIFTISVAVSLLLSKARVMAAVITVANTTSTNSIDCGDGQPFCCIEDRSQLGNVNDDACQSYSENCLSGYLPSCCYIVTNMKNYYYCEEG
ncbi:hypothetical protein EV424DRAFT_256075 [Suillus variegatus]|nr:hypothetical protein EV424DRAFT_256075 [Suillus variegatus]